MKITELNLENSKFYYKDKELDPEILDDFHNQIDLESENIKTILLKISNYDKLPNENDLNLYIHAKSLSSLLRCKIIEDSTIPAEAFDGYFVEQHQAVRDLLHLNIEYVNSYDLDFDSKNLKEHDDGSYTFNDEICIESNNRTSNFFRDFLILFNSENNVLYLADQDDTNQYKLQQHFTSHKFLCIPTLNKDKRIEDILDELCHHKYGYSEMSNICLAKYLTYYNDEEDVVNVDRILDILSMDNIRNHRYSDENYYLNLVELQAVKLKEPIILFNELMSLDNIADIQHGLLRLGFNLIE